MVALASAFVRLRPEVDKREAQQAGKQMGDAAGVEAGKGITDGTQKALRDSKGQFVKGGVDAGKAIGGGIDKGLEEAKARAARTGGDAGKAWGDGFHRDSQGKIRDAQGKFVQSSIASGDKAGKGFAKSFGKGSEGIVSSIKGNLKMAAGVFVPLGLAAAVGEIGKIGIAYEDNLNIFQTVTKATGVQMDAVAAKARALGSDVKLPGVSAAGAAAAMTELGKAGFTVEQAMDAAQGTLQLARIAGIDEADAATIAANAVNAFGIEAKDTGFVVDELAAAANSSSIEISDASLAFKQAASIFSGVQGPAIGAKESITELNTAIAILGNNGIKGSDAGTSLKQMMLQLTGPTQQAQGQMDLLAQRAAGATVSLQQQEDVLHGSKSVRDKALESIKKHNKGLQLEGSLAYDANGKMRGLRDILKLTEEGTKGLTQEDKNYAITQIFGADASRSVLALLKGGLPVYDKQRKAVLQSGAAADVAAAKNKGLGGALDNVKSQIENASIAVYNVVKGPLTTALNAIANALPAVFGAIGKVFGFLADHKGTVLAVAYAVGALTLAIQAQNAAIAISAAGGVIKFLTSFAKGTRIAAAAQWLFNAALDANPIGITVLAIAALVAAFVVAYKNSERFRAIVQGALNGIKVAAQATADFFMTKVVPVLKAVWDGIAAGAVWLYQKVLKPTFDAIAWYVKNVLIPVFTFLWRNVIVPVFNAIGTAISFAWNKVIKPVFGALKFYFENVVFPVFRFLYNNVISPIFKVIGKLIEVWWLAVRVVFAALKLYFTNVLFPVIRFLYNNVVKPVFKALGDYIGYIWNSVVKPVFGLLKRGFEAAAATIKLTWNTIIKPIFKALGGYIKDVVAPAFSAGVGLIAKAWEKIREVARKPVAFVVNHVINPFINGINAAAKIVGVTNGVKPITGFADGGQVAKTVKRAAGGKISGAGGTTDNRQAVIPGVGSVQLMGGEYVVNREDTAKALPILKWINNGMKGGLDKVKGRIGRPLTDYPGDGSEGWAFKDGGLVGWTKDVWKAITNPGDLIKKPFDSALRNIGGGGTIRKFLIAQAEKFAKGAISHLTSFGGDDGTFSKHFAGRLGTAYNYIRAQNGKPYVWASAGPNGYDCSGIVDAAYNILKGRDPNSHTFSTASAGSYFDTRNQAGPLLAGWSHPGQAPASASVGHMAGQIAGMPFESRGSRGVIVGNGARRIGQFAQTGAARLADGGLTPSVPKVRLFDDGGYWPSGTLGANMSGRTEYVDPKGRGGGGGTTINNWNFYGPVSSKQGAQDMVLGAYKQLVKERKIPDPNRGGR